MSTPAATDNAGARYDRMSIRWGRGTEMTAVEASLWHVSDVATLRAASVVVEVLDCAPDWERFRAGHAWALGRVPRLRQRVVADPLRLGPPAWADTRVDLDHHLRRVRLPPGATIDAALSVASAMHERPFHPDRPLWEAALVEGLPGGRAAYVLKLHHAMADDHAIILLFDLLHSHVREPTTTAPRLPPGHHEPCTPLQLTAQHALGTPRVVAHAALTGLRAGTTMLRRPARGAVRSVQVARSVGALVTARAGAPSPLLRRRGPERAFAAIDVPTAQLRAAAHAAGGRTTDAMLAVAVDGLARYHAALGVPVTELPVAVPLHLRAHGSDEGTRGRIGVPVGGEGGTRGLIAELRSRITAAEERRHVDVLRALAPAASRAPTLLVGRLASRATRSLALQAFVIRGLDRDAFLAGAQVLRMFTFSPTSGCALSATLVAHQQTACLGFNVDTAAVTDVDLLVRCLHEALADVLAGAPASA